jgi:hypothetical protein
MKSNRLASLIATILCLTGIGAAGFLAPAPVQGGKPNPDLPVTSTLTDAGSVVDGTNYRIQSDGNGSYFNGVASVESIIQGALGDWVLDASASTSRSVLVDFRDPAPGSSTSNAPFEWQLIKARFISKCSLLQSGGYLSMAAGSTMNCPLHAAFTFGGASYRLTMNPANDGATSYAQVTCNAVNASGKCNNWTVTPVTQADSSVRSIAVLLRDTTVKGKTTTTNLGYFYMTFQIGLTNP